MSQATSVKVSSRNRITVPGIARKKLDIKSGDRLLVDVQEGMMILIPQPPDPVAHMAGLHREVWEKLDPAAYLDEEREAWNDSESS